METQLSCPSYLAKAGAELFGIVNSEGKVELLAQSIKIDKTFVEEAKKSKPAEERFRFSGKCIEGGCGHWVGTKQKCGLAEKVIHTFQKPLGNAPIECPIREKCRWFKQESHLACANCTEIFRNQELQFVQII